MERGQGASRTWHRILGSVCGPLLEVQGLRKRKGPLACRLLQESVLVYCDCSRISSEDFVQFHSALPAFASVLLVCLRGRSLHSLTHDLRYNVRLQVTKGTTVPSSSGFSSSARPAMHGTRTVLPICAGHAVRFGPLCGHQQQQGQQIHLPGTQEHQQ